MKKETIIGVLKEHKQEYEFPKSYWESTLLETLSETIQILDNLEMDKSVNEQ